MKPETAAGEKTVQENQKKYYSADGICDLLAAHLPKTRQTDRQTEFWFAVKAILRKTPEMAGQLMNPTLKNWFINTFDVWLERANNQAIVLPLDSIHERCKHGGDCVGCLNCIVLL
jgi:hypothetical protein